MAPTVRREMDKPGKIMVAGIPKDDSFTEADLEKAFAPYGRITEANVVTDSRTKQSRGFGFVTYENPKDANDAIKAMEGKDLGGSKPVHCEQATLGFNLQKKNQEEEDMKRGGGDRGRGRGGGDRGRGRGRIEMGESRGWGRGREMERGGFRGRGGGGEMRGRGGGEMRGRGGGEMRGRGGRGGGGEMRGRGGRGGGGEMRGRGAYRGGGEMRGRGAYRGGGEEQMMRGRGGFRGGMRGRGREMGGGGGDLYEEEYYGEEEYNQQEDFGLENVHHGGGGGPMSAYGRGARGGGRGGMPASRGSRGGGRGGMSAVDGGGRKALLPDPGRGGGRGGPMRGRGGRGAVRGGGGHVNQQGQYYEGGEEYYYEDAGAGGDDAGYYGAGGGDEYYEEGGYGGRGGGGEEYGEGEYYEEDGGYGYDNNHQSYSQEEYYEGGGESAMTRGRGRGRGGDTQMRGRGRGMMGEHSQQQRRGLMEHPARQGGGRGAAGSGFAASESNGRRTLMENPRGRGRGGPVAGAAARGRRTLMEGAGAEPQARRGGMPSRAGMMGAGGAEYLEEEEIVRPLQRAPHQRQAQAQGEWRGAEDYSKAEDGQGGDYWEEVYNTAPSRSMAGGRGGVRGRGRGRGGHEVAATAAAGPRQRQPLLGGDPYSTSGGYEEEGVEEDLYSRRPLQSSAEKRYRQGGPSEAGVMRGGARGAQGMTPAERMRQIEEAYPKEQGYGEERRIPSAMGREFDPHSRKRMMNAEAGGMDNVAVLQRQYENILDRVGGAGPPAPKRERFDGYSYQGR